MQALGWEKWERGDMGLIYVVSFQTVRSGFISAVVLKHEDRQVGTQKDGAWDGRVGMQS